MSIRNTSIRNTSILNASIRSTPHTAHRITNRKKTNSPAQNQKPSISLGFWCVVGLVCLLGYTIAKYLTLDTIITPFDEAEAQLNSSL